MPGVRGIGPKTAVRMLRGGRHLEDLDDELTISDRVEARHQRSLHRLLADVDLPAMEPSPLPAHGLASAASVLDVLGLWDEAYP